MIRRILVGVDRSARAKELVASVIALAARLDATIVPVTAVPEMPKRADSEEHLAEAKAALRAMLQAETLVRIAPPFVRVGAPWRVILDAAKAFETDAIVIGSGEDGGLGGTASRVVRLADRTVFVLKQRIRPTKHPILAGLDTSDQALVVFDSAAWVAHRLGVGVNPVRAIEAGGWGPPDEDSELRLVNLISNELVDIATRNPLATLNAPIVRQGPAWSVILSAADDIDAELVVLGGWSNDRRDVIGRNAARALELLTRNVVLVRQAPKSSIPPA